MIFLKFASKSKKKMVIRPLCKINIGLNIVEKRKDGFHSIETVFYPISQWTDTLEITTCEGDSSLVVEPQGLTTTMEDNLCMKALRLLQRDLPVGQVTMRLQKNIPVGAGLGGGSSDAAAVLNALNELFHLNLTDEALQRYAAQLGSDVAFFIRSMPVYATGRGEVMRPISIDLSQKVITVIHPGLHISTAEAYAGVTPHKADYSLEEAVKLPVSEWKGLIKNDFEDTLFVRYPVLQRLKEHLYAQGADYVSLSGSGSAVYAIGDEKYFGLNH
jgi:4-diphosphocytidyl-2-C-methyl-D-erythritol kinase